MKLIGEGAIDSTVYSVPRLEISPRSSLYIDRLTPVTQKLISHSSILRSLHHMLLIHMNDLIIGMILDQILKPCSNALSKHLIISRLIHCTQLSFI